MSDDIIVLVNFCTLYLELYSVKQVTFFNTHESVLIREFVFSNKLRFVKEYSYAFFVMLNLFKLRYNRIYLNVQFYYFTNLSIHIERTLFLFSSIYYVFLPRYYYRALPPMNNSKMICDYLIY